MNKEILNNSIVKETNDIRTVMESLKNTGLGIAFVVNRLNKVVGTVTDGDVRKSLLETEAGPKSFVMTMNAGSVPYDHWVNDLNVGGGRIIGEACHYIDLMRFLVGKKISTKRIRCTYP